MLKSFAAAARTQLIKEVSARLTIVLQESGAVRREFPAIVEKLDKEIRSEGGGSLGQRNVAERVAYTWFNRIVALRFMDANHYTGVSVVSPQAGVALGQPEVLVDAKRGHIDTQIVATATAEHITGLLNRTRTSDDPQGEAYGLLLTAYCRHWNRAMPFMFERDGDYTELLMPAALLSDESVIAKATMVLTPEVCQDVEVIGWLYQFYIAERKEEIFAGFKKNRKAGAAEIPAATQMFTPHWIVRYLLENSLGRIWLLNRPDSKLAKWMEYYIAPVDAETEFLKIGGPEELKILDPACGSGHMLTYAFDLLYAIYEEEGYPPSEIPNLILANNLYGTEIDPRAGALAAFVLTMKARARQRTVLNKAIEPNVCVLEPMRFTPTELDTLVSSDGDRAAEEQFLNQFADADTLGSLIRPREELIGEISPKLAVVGDTDLFASEVLERACRVVKQAEYLSSRYHVVVANPPYMGSKNMSAGLSEWAKRDWPNSKSDLFAMFIERCLQLTQHGGLVGMITMQSWMFLSSYQKLREDLLASRTIISMAHLGSNAFDSISGDVVSTTAFVVENRSSIGSSASYVRLVDGSSEASKRAMLVEAVRDCDYKLRYRAKAEDFHEIPGSPIAYWLSYKMINAFSASASIADIAPAKIGMRTGDNSKFLRRWFEVERSQMINTASSGQEVAESGQAWVPYNKGGDFRKWYGNNEYVVLWRGDGRQIKSETLEKYPALSWDNLGWKISNESFFFRRCLTWTFVSSSSFGVRISPSGFIFDVGGSCAFPKIGWIDTVASYLCSPIAFEFMKALNPTLNFQIQNVNNLPWRTPGADDLKSMRRLAEEAEKISREDWNSNEISWDFQSSELLSPMPHRSSLSETIGSTIAGLNARTRRLFTIETELSHLWARTFDLKDANIPDVKLEQVTLYGNPLYRYGKDSNDLLCVDLVKDIVSYTIGCVFGRYSLDRPGLILANQGDSLHEYLAQVPEPSFEPDADNVIPILDDDWFDDDIVGRFRKFLRVTFGDEHFEENLRFIEAALGKDIRKYFVADFYKDHVQRYKKRPIYWLFSSAKGSFNALIYMHRYRSSTVSTVLNEYLREFQAKLRAELGNQERISGDPATSTREKARADKELDRIHKVLLEVGEYEHDVLYPLATQQIVIDLDDGVKVNYPKFGAALKKIPGLEATGD